MSLPTQPALDAVSPQIFRDAMSRIGSAVHIVTTGGSRGPAGLTATAVCSVSDAPPSILVCVHEASNTGKEIFRNGLFCVNALAAQDRELADIFAGKRGIEGAERFVHGTWTTGKTGAPVLKDAVAALDCVLRESTRIGSHRILIGTIVDVMVPMEDGPSLAWRNRAYRDL